MTSLIKSSPPCAVALICVLSGIAGARPSNGYIFFAPGGVTCCHNTSMTLEFAAEVSPLGTRHYFSATQSWVCSSPTATTISDIMTT